jgi:hypothetical protein
MSGDDDVDAVERDEVAERLPYAPQLDGGGRAARSLNERFCRTAGQRVLPSLA